jgi:hypothetical protein
MSEFVEDLFTFLATASTDAGTRFYPRQLPQGVTLPACAYFKVSDPKDHTHSGPSSLKQPRYQIDCFSMSYLDAVKLASQLEAALDGYKGTMGDHTVQASFIDDAGKDDHDPETDRHKVSIDVLIWNKET